MISTVYVAYFSVYIALMFGTGVYYARKIKSMDQYLVADRNVGFWRIVGTIIATSCGAAALIPSLFQIFIFSIPALAIQYIGMGTILATFLGMGMKTGIVVSFVIISIYTLLGGLPAVIDTDRIQAIILTLALFLFFLFGIRYAGGMEKVLDMTFELT